jgi:hypothetical protein
VNVQFDIDLPPEVEVGTHADFANVWHTNESFVLDFIAIKGPPSPLEDDNGDEVAVIPGRVAARVRLAPTHVFELMKALEQQLTSWETATGNRPGPATEPTGE